MQTRQVPDLVCDRDPIDLSSWHALSGADGVGENEEPDSRAVGHDFRDSLTHIVDVAGFIDILGQPIAALCEKGAEATEERLCGRPSKSLVLGSQDEICDE